MVIPQRAPPFQGCQKVPDNTHLTAQFNFLPCPHVLIITPENDTSRIQNVKENLLKLFII